MKLRRITKMLSVLIAGAIGLLVQSGGQAIAADMAEPNVDSGVEVLTRGPVHEAFAEPNSFNPTQGIVIPKEVPAAIEEIPPTDKPEGDSLWIPGYWQWDSERSDFIWISGIWRVPPPDCSWVPGYWTAVSDGWTWTPGFWLASQTDEVAYLPQPPKSLEVGPSSPAPSADYIWAPGCWFWTDARYAWRPGYWLQARADWVWSPAYYVDTPRGSVYIDGYWDWTIDRRGVLFAPAYIHRSTWERPGYVYSPSIVIQMDLLTAHLFISPNFNHYYFGDYYDSGYSSRGIYPWFEFQKRHRGYDPIYAQERWSHGRTDSHWEQNVRDEYNYRMKHADARPPRLYSAQADFAARGPERERKNAMIGASLSDVVKRSDSPIRYEKVNEDRRKSFEGQKKDIAKYRDQRAQWESSGKKIEADHGAPGYSKESKVTPQDQSNKSGEAQRVGLSKEPVQVQPDRAPKQKDNIQIAQPQGREKTYKAPQITEPQKQKIPRSPVVGMSSGNLNQKVRPPSRPELPQPGSGQRAEPAQKDKPAHGDSKPLDSSNGKERDKGDKSGR